MSLEAGDAAPAFALEVERGSAQPVPDPSGRPVLLFFFKVDCPTCPLAAPVVEAIALAYAHAPRPVRVVAVGQDGPGPAVAWMREHGLTVPLSVEREGFPASRALGLTAVPASLVVAADGRVAAAVVGWNRAGYQGLADAVAGLCGAAPAEVIPAGLPAFRPG